MPVALTGCGEKAKPLPETVPVSGTVTLMDGKPLANATVSFVPTGTTKGLESTAMTDASGHYELPAPRPDAPTKKGVAPGTFIVQISKHVQPNGQELPAGTKAIGDAPAAMTTKNLVLPEYNRESKLFETVKAPGGTFDFKVQTRK